MEEKKEYIGSQAIKSKTVAEEANLVGVVLENNQKYEFSLRQFEAVVSSEPYDDGMIERKKWNPLVSTLLREMLADGMLISEKDTILNILDNSVVSNYNRAVSLLFNCNHPSDINIKILDAVLKDKGYIAFPEVKKEE